MDLQLVVPGSMTVDAFHAICDRIEAALKEEVRGVVVTIHVEPEGKAKHRGIPVLTPGSAPSRSGPGMRDENRTHR